MKEIKGNLLDTELKAIIHGCNAQGVMGAGVAKAIAKKYPECKKHYMECLKDDLDHAQNIQMTSADHWFYVMGKSYQYIDKQSGLSIFNLITQYYYGIENCRYVSYDALYEGIETIILEHNDMKQFAIPRIGCGLGGGSWTVVRAILEDLEDKYGVEFWVYEL